MGNRVRAVLGVVHRRLARINIVYFLKYVKYVKALKSTQGQLREFPRIFVGNCSADPREFFNYYDGYSFWLFDKLLQLGHGKKILDVGNTKSANAILSLSNDVTALVLQNCEDCLSKVTYLEHDISDPLPLYDNQFDVFTSSTALHLAGLGRYGDKLDPTCLPKFVEELNRVMKKKSDLIFSISYGPNCLSFNEGYTFDIDALKKLFSRWILDDWLIDNKSSNFRKRNTGRYAKDLSLAGWKAGEYRVIFLHFKRS